MSQPTQVKAGSRKTATWTIVADADSPALSSQDIVALRTDADGTTTQIDAGDVDVTDTASGGTVKVTVRFADSTPTGRVVVRLDCDTAASLPEFADEAVFVVSAASAQRP